MHLQAVGCFYSGIITAVAAPSGDDVAPDPWCSLTVAWDDGGAASSRVSPWEIEEDPEELKRQQVRANSSSI